MVDVTRAPRIQSITMAVYPGTERAAAFDHAISLAVAHQADVGFTHEQTEYSVRRADLHNLVLKGGQALAQAATRPAAVVG